jgi:hypothetical protein
MFPYRWKPRTIIPNLTSAGYDIWYGIINIIRWIPVIWFDRDYDWAYLAEIMEYKLRRMSKLFEDGHHVLCKRDARRTLICAELLKRLRTEEYQYHEVIDVPVLPHNPKRDDLIGKYYQEYLGTIIGKHLRGWWD